MALGDPVDDLSLVSNQLHDHWGNIQTYTTLFGTHDTGNEYQHEPRIYMFFFIVSLTGAIIYFLIACIKIY